MTTSFTTTTAAALDPTARHDERRADHVQLGTLFQREGMGIYRKTCRSTDMLQLAPTAAGDGFLLGIAMAPGHHRRITQGELAGLHHFADGDVYLRDLQDPYAAEVDTPFDFALFEFSRASFDSLADERFDPARTDLHPVTARRDPVLQHLAHAVLPSLAQASRESTLYVTQILSAMAVYLVHAFGGRVAAKGRSGVLSHVHAERAKALLRSKMHGECSIADIARQCNMSTSYFMRAFKKTTGKTPHQWMLSQRIALAQDYLRNSGLTLAEVATRCNFSDQSHFSRAFNHSLGMSPSAWRRQAA
ncbi:helix-turn-helix transcriptional regulator [Herbaspirillum sp. NPDC087042]|uniref:helix-turn-helix transcriptional regulator n=1 Tax=Herbaspirillum sp. NPDC087042 TaxID=3364004 RepID=UPI0037F79063